MEEPFFDEDAELGDYIDDDDFGGPPPNNDEDYDMMMMMMMEEDIMVAGQQQQQQRLQPPPSETTPVEATTPNQPRNLNVTFNDDDDEGTIPMETTEDNNDVSPTSAVEEYLAARKTEHQLFSFERYKKNVGWRTSSLSAGSVDAHDANPSSSASFKRHHSKTFFSPTKSKWVAPDAQFLDLLQLRADMENRKLGPKLLLKRSTNGVLKTPQEGVDTVPMTLADGSRVYVRCRTTNTTAASSDNSSQAGCSLGVSMRELMRRVDGIKRQRLAIRHRLHSKNATTPKAMLDHGDLWVDRHAPVSFPHLLSDERTNREVLRALRAWDPYVFGRKQPSRPTNHVLFHQQQGGIDASSKGGDQDNSSSKTPSNPLDKRPEESRRVILLSGPPGVGKTTLAHIVARHAGYRPLEVNASDERSASVLTDRIQRAMESTTIKLTSDGDKNDYGKPNCLILDEIDGADAKGAIQALVDIVKADMPSKNTKQKSSYLRRPIICICNHKYAPALRPLLPFAVQFNVDPPSSARLVARLKSILNKESLSMMAGGSLLHQLVVSTGGDIRSCLFTLQFAAAEAESSKDLSQALASSLSGTGLKDDRSDIASTITTVFRKVKSKAIESTRASLSSRRSNDRVSVSRVIDAVEGFGDDSTAVNALFMNILRVSYIDPAFDRCSAAHELLSAADLSQGSGYSMQRVFTPPMAAGIHLLCRVEVKPKLNFSSREMADAHFQLESNQALIQKFSEGLPTKAKNLKCRDLLSKEFIPMILWVLSAGEGAASLCRAASSIDILTKVEREIANNHVAALCALGLTYIPDNEEQINNKPSFRMDTTAMRLEPPIHRLVHYNFLKRPGGLRRKEIPATMKELLAHQVRLESFRIRDEAGETSATPPDVDSKESRNGHLSANIGASKSADHNTLTMETEPSPSKFTPRKLEQIAASIPAAKRTKTTPSPTAGNFLGIAAKKDKEAKSARRAAALGLNRTSQKLKMAHTESGFALNQVVRMKYVKGFTQAVRTPCRLQDLE